MRDSTSTPANISCQKAPFPLTRQTRPTRTPMIRDDGPETVEWVRMEPSRPCQSASRPQGRTKMRQSNLDALPPISSDVETYYTLAYIHIPYIQDAPLDVDARRSTLDARTSSLQMRPA